MAQQSVRRKNQTCFHAPRARGSHLDSRPANSIQASCPATERVVGRRRGSNSTARTSPPKSSCIFGSAHGREVSTTSRITSGDELNRQCGVKACAGGPLHRLSAHTFQLMNSGPNSARLVQRENLALTSRDACGAVKGGHLGYACEPPLRSALDGVRVRTRTGRIQGPSCRARHTCDRVSAATWRPAE